MNWRVKAAIQNTLAKLPPAFGNPAYYWLQRRMGNMRRIDPTERVQAALDFCEMLEATGTSPVDGRFLDLGTGWRVNIPIALWLCGARSVVTVDLNRYLKPALVRRDVRFMREHRARLESLLGARLDPSRLDALTQLDSRSWQIDDLFRLCSIDYIAPGDAAQLPFESNSLDFEVSHMVLEHIPLAALQAIHREAVRVLRPGGKVLHRIDLSDHFQHSDGTISPLNFLQFDDDQWRAIAGNRFMFMNRLRIDDYLRLIEEAGLRVVSCRRYADERGLQQLDGPSFHVDAQFAGKSRSDLATTAAWVVAEKPAS